MILVDEELEKLNIMELICENPDCRSRVFVRFTLSGLCNSQPEPFSAAGCESARPARPFVLSVFCAMTHFL